MLRYSQPGPWLQHQSLQINSLHEFKTDRPEQCGKDGKGRVQYSYNITITLFYVTFFLLLLHRILLHLLLLQLSTLLLLLNITPGPRTAHTYPAAEAAANSPFYVVALPVGGVLPLSEALWQHLRVTSRASFTCVCRDGVTASRTPRTS